MNDISDLSFTIKPKSDQLNADDLLVSSKIIAITSVKIGGQESPVIIHYDGDDGRPWKPCKTTRRALISAWGRDGNKWVGRSAELYCDPAVKYAGQEVGGIRISHLSDIPRTLKLKLTATRGRRAEVVIEPLQVQPKLDYPTNKFSKVMPEMKKRIESGEMTAEQVIARCEQTGKLTEEMRKQIRDLDPDKTDTPESSRTNDDEFFGEE